MSPVRHACTHAAAGVLPAVDTQPAQHPAQLLNDLLAAGDIPVHKVDRAKAQYAMLHGELVRALANERDLLDKARALKKQKEASGVADCVQGGRGVWAASAVCTESAGWWCILS